MRQFSEEAYVSLKRAVEVAYSLAGGVSLFALVTRVKIPVLSKYASNGADNAETFMPIDVALDLDRAAKQPVILSQMADLQGYDLVPKGEGPIAPRRVTDGDAIDFMSEAMDVVRTLQTSRADGKICTHDAKRILAEIADLEREIDDLKRNLGEGWSMDAFSRPSVIIEVPLEGADRAFLRSVRTAGGRVQLVTVAQRQGAKACQRAGYVQILDNGKTARLTGRGQAYLDKLARAH